MRKPPLIFLLLGVFFTTLLNAQPVTTSSTPKDLEQTIISQYYDYIYSGELMIMNGQYDAARLLYDKAFSINKKPFTFDMYNYQELVRLQGDSVLVRKIDSTFNKLQKTYIESEAKYKSREDTLSSVAFLKSMLKSDQRDRFLAMKTTNKIYEGKSGKMIRHNDSLRYTSFIERFGDTGYPSVYETGTKYVKAVGPFLGVLIGHWKSQGFDIKGFLMKSLEKGDLRAVDVAFLLDNGEKYGIPLAYTFNGETTNSYKKLTLADVEERSKNRKKILLEDYSDYIQKYEYQKSTKTNFVLVRMDYAYAKFD